MGNLSNLTWSVIMQRELKWYPLFALLPIKQSTQIQQTCLFFCWVNYSVVTTCAELTAGISSDLLTKRKTPRAKIILRCFDAIPWLKRRHFNQRELFAARLPFCRRSVLLPFLYLFTELVVVQCYSRVRSRFRPRSGEKLQIVAGRRSGGGEVEQGRERELSSRLTQAPPRLPSSTNNRTLPPQASICKVSH